MRTTLLISAVAAIVMMTGCGPLTSLHPLWDEGHLVSEPALEGMWFADEDNEILVVTRTKNQDLRMMYVATDGVAQYEVHVLRLGEHRYLDLCPDAGTGNGILGGDSFMPALPLHFFARLELSGDTMKLALLDEDAFAKKVESGDIRISQEKTDSGLVLTAATRVLQEFVSKHAADGELWGEVASWHRRSSRSGLGY